jgi:hypothetical protein
MRMETRPPIPLGVRIGSVLGLCGAALYLYWATYYVVVTLAEDHVGPGDLSMRGGGIGFALAGVALLGGLSVLAAALAAPRFWRRGEALLAVLVLIYAVGMAAPPLARLFTPESA